ncbi:MAG: HAMP domain-containing protein [Bacteroidales bacterium]|nr:HAMP domain-containing protein [Bacteroidales bacterium]
MPRNSIFEKLIIYFMLLSMGAIGVVGVYSYISARKAQMARTYDQLATVRYLKKIEIESFYLQRVNEAKIIASDPELLTSLQQPSSSVRNARISHSLINNLNTAGNFSSIRISSESESFLCSFPQADCRFEKDTSGIIKFNDAVQEVTITDLIQGSGNQWSQFIIVPIPVNSPDKLFLSLEIASSSIDQLMPDHNPLNGLGKSGEAYLVGSDRKLKSSSRFIKDAINRVSIDTSTLSMAFSGHDGIWLLKDYRGIEVLGSYSILAPPLPRWVLIAELDKKEAMIPIYAIRNHVIFITVFIACIVFIATWFISRMITRPLTQLQQATRELGTGKFGTKVDIRSNDEIGDLAETFNIMSAELLEKDRLLEKERARRMKAAFDGQDTERQRLSRELHDGLGQSLIAQKLRLESFKTPDEATSNHAMDELKTCADQLVDEVRRISNALMPAQLNQFGLVAAVRQHCEEVIKFSGLEVSFEATGNFEPMSRKSKTYLFRIIQEALNNVVKHAGASQAAIEMARTRDHIFLSISDNGKGFDQEKICHGNGLNNMRERASLLNGILTFHSMPGKGTTLEIQIPTST